MPQQPQQHDDFAQLAQIMQFVQPFQQQQQQAEQQDALMQYHQQTLQQGAQQHEAEQRYRMTQLAQTGQYQQGELAWRKNQLETQERERKAQLMGGLLRSHLSSGGSFSDSTGQEIVASLDPALAKSIYESVMTNKVNQNLPMVQAVYQNMMNEPNKFAKHNKTLQNLVGQMQPDVVARFPWGAMNAALPETDEPARLPQPQNLSAETQASVDLAKQKTASRTKSDQRQAAAQKSVGDLDAYMKQTLGPVEYGRWADQQYKGSYGGLFGSKLPTPVDMSEFIPQGWNN